jgi:hypothetical protein
MITKITTMIPIIRALRPLVSKPANKATELRATVKHASSGDSPSMDAARQLRIELFDVSADAVHDVLWQYAKRFGAAYGH